MKQDGTLFTLENDDLLVTVARHGAELTRIYDKKAGREILWGADPAVWDRHAPVLFPFVGKCYEGRYIHEEKEYAMPTQHGFARDMEFEPVLCDMDECWFKLKDTPETFAKYPFHFELEIGHRLEGRTITVMWKVTNQDSGEMLFMIGGYRRAGAFTISPLNLTAKAAGKGSTRTAFIILRPRRKVMSQGNCRARLSFRREGRL